MASPSDPPPGPSADGPPALPTEPTRTESSRAPSPPPSAAGAVPPDPHAAPGQRSEPRRRPWAWIAVCGVLALVVVGVIIWALSLRCDLDHQKDQTAAAQQQAAKASSEVDQLTQDVNNAIDQAGQAGAAAKDQLQGALADLKDRLGALKDETKPPAGGSGAPEATATPSAAPAAATTTATPAENATPDGP